MAIKDETAAKMNRMFKEEGMLDEIGPTLIDTLVMRIGEDGVRRIVGRRGVSICDDDSQALAYDDMAEPVGNISIFDLSKAVYRDMSLWRMGRTFDEIPASAQNILDIGCGTGLEACFIAEQMPHAQVVGIDISPRMIERARSRASRRGVHNVSFFEGDRDHLPFARNAFDAAVYLNCLTENTPADTFQFNINYEHTLRHRLNQVYRVLNDGGVLVLVQPSAYESDSYVAQENRRRLANVGFEIVREDRGRFDHERYGDNSLVLLSAKKDRYE